VVPLGTEVRSDRVEQTDPETCRPGNAGRQVRRERFGDTIRNSACRFATDWAIRLAWRVAYAVPESAVVALTPGSEPLQRRRAFRALVGQFPYAVGNRRLRGRTT